MISFSVGGSAWPSPGMGTRGRFCAGTSSTACEEAEGWEHHQTQSLWPFFFLFTRWDSTWALHFTPLGFFHFQISPENNRESGGVLWALTQRKSATLHSDKGQENREKQNLSLFNKVKGKKPNPVYWLWGTASTSFPKSITEELCWATLRQHFQSFFFLSPLGKSGTPTWTIVAC